MTKLPEKEQIKVKDLIAQLQKCNPEALVWLDPIDCGAYTWDLEVVGTKEVSGHGISYVNILWEHS